MPESLDDQNLGLFILVQDGKPVNHPVTGSNLTMIFPNFDPDDPPEPFEKFKRIPVPRIGQMHQYIGTTYEKFNGVWQDVHQIELLPLEERTKKISDYVRANPKPFESWIFNENDLRWEPPVPMPIDGNVWYWNESLQKWYQNIIDIEEEFNQQFLTPILIKSVDELPPSGPVNKKQQYMLETNFNLYRWQDDEWQLMPIPEPVLEDQVVIDAYLDSQPVKVLGILQNIIDLNENYSGDFADAYIIKDINRLYAWNGNEWVDTPVKFPWLDNVS